MLNETISRVMELINQEPRYYAELVRIFMDENDYGSWSYWAEYVSKALWVLLNDERIKRTQVVANRLVTSTIWQPYSIYTPEEEPPIGWGMYNVKGKEKLDRIARISDIGLINAEMFENLVYRVVRERYRDAVHTPFSSPLPDVYVPSQNLIVEATTRFEFPITVNYIKWKYYHLAEPFKDAYFNEERPLKMLLIGPVISPSAWKFVRKGQFDPNKGIYQAYANRMPAIKMIQFPKTNSGHAGWPLFRKFAYYKRWLEEFHRKVYILPRYNDAKRKLYLAFNRAVTSWEQQEEVLIRDKSLKE